MLNFVSCPQSDVHRFNIKSVSSCGVPRVVSTKRTLSRPIRLLISTSGNPNGSKGDLLSVLQNLDNELQDAIRREEYTVASGLKRQIEEMRRDVSLGVLQCNAEFYRAFREGDAAAMDRIWTSRQRDGVDMATCAHPGHATIAGRTAVLDGWRQIMSAGAPNIRPEAVKVFVAGAAAWVVCEEHVDGAPACLATNIFVWEDGPVSPGPAGGGGGGGGGGWRMAHHQGGALIFHGLRIARQA